MSTKVANVIAIELGVLIALLAWLAIARVPSVRPNVAAHERAPDEGSFAPVLRSPPKNLYAANEKVARRTSAQWPEEQVAPVDEAQQYQAQPEAADYGAPQYASAAEPSDSPQGYVYEPSPGYLSDQLEPVLPSDYYYQPYADYVAFAQPAQVVVFSNNRSRSRSRRSQACSSPRRAMPARQHASGGRQVARSGGMPPRQHVMNPPVRQSPAHAGSVAARGGNRTVGQVGNGRARGGPISVLQ
jgi:hypothetical protein